VTRTLTLVLSGILSSVLALTAFVVLRATLGRDMGGDTESPRLAVALAAGAIVVAITGVAVATTRPWSRRLSVAVGLASVIAGFGGLIYFLVASLIVSGMFPSLLLDRLNLTIALVMGLIGLTGLGLLMRSTGVGDERRDQSSVVGTVMASGRGRVRDRNRGGMDLERVHLARHPIRVLPPVRGIIQPAQ
jgi:hypothetical protein